MAKSIISEGKTTTEAIEKGLAELRLGKDKVEIKIIEAEEKRSFFSILAPRVVKVELTVKEGVEVPKKEEKTKNVLEAKDKVEKKEEIKREERLLDKESEDVKIVVTRIEEFLRDFLSKLPTEGITSKVEVKEAHIYVTVLGDRLNYLIGYRGETLNAVQTILSSIASRYSKEKIRILVDIENYREKREKALEDLAEKIAKTVVKTKKQVVLEPMSSYERKIIHSKLQENNRVKTYSTGAEPYRKVVIALK